jgi:hypothetical protein
MKSVKQSMWIEPSGLISFYLGRTGSAGAAVMSSRIAITVILKVVSGSMTNYSTCKYI